MSIDRGQENTQVKCLRDKQINNSICISVRSFNVGRPPADLRKQEPGSIFRHVSKRSVQHDCRVRCPVIVTS